MDSPEKNKGMQVAKSDEDILIPFIRSRLYVISTSLYLLEGEMNSRDYDCKKYLKKINEELEMIRKFINI
jgi:hypothetical protein